MGGGSSPAGTTTSTQTNVPWNASQLGTIQNQAIGLMGSNPINYYPGQTYAGPSDYTTQGLGQAGDLGLASGNLIRTLVPRAQQAALEQNTSLAEGSGIANMMPWFDQLSKLGNQNPAQAGMTDLSGIANGGYANGAQPWLQGLAGLANGQAATQLGNAGAGQYLQGASPYLSGLRDLTSGQAATALGNAANGGVLAGGQPFVSGLQGLTSGAAANALGGLAGGQYLNQAQPYIGALGGLAGGEAAGDLARTAGGAYLGANPYLNAQYNAGANPLINAFMSATAPQTDSTMASAGRFNSGALANAQSVNQQNLGKSLGDFGANLYGSAYQNERGLMNQAATNLGSLQTNALNSALGQYGTQVGLLNQGATNLGALQQSALNSAGNLYGNYANLGINAAGQLGNLQMGALSNAGSLYGQQTGQAINAATNLGNLQTNALTNTLGAYKDLGNLTANAAYNMGNLGIGGQNSQINALNSALGNYNQATGLQEHAIDSTPALSNMAYGDYQQAISAGNQQQQLAQQQIQDQMNRFYGNQMAPWSTLQQAAGNVGGAVQGTSQLTQPYFMPSTGSQILGGLGSAAQIGGMFKCDIRTKENIRPMEPVLNKIREIEAFRFDYRDWARDDESMARPQIGVMAQQVRHEFPEAVVEKDGTLYVDYRHLTAVLLKAVNELTQKVERLEDGLS